MSDTFSVLPHPLTDHGERVALAVGALDRSALPDAARVLAAAVPGSRTAHAAEALAARWEAAVRAWADDLAAHADALRCSGRDYAAVDGAVADGLR